MNDNAPNASSEALEKIASFGYAIQSSDTPLAQNLPDFPCDNLKLIARTVESNPKISIFKSIYRLYPYNTFLPKESHGSVSALLSSLNIAPHRFDEQKIVSIKPVAAKSENKCDGNFEKKTKFGVKCLKIIIN